MTAAGLYSCVHTTDLLLPPGGTSCLSALKACAILALLRSLLSCSVQQYVFFPTLLEGWKKLWTS